MGLNNNYRFSVKDIRRPTTYWLRRCEVTKRNWKGMKNQFKMNSAKSTKMNSWQAIYNFVKVISAKNSFNLGQAFHCLHKPPFSSFSRNVGADYCPRIIPKPVQLSTVTLNSKSRSTEHFKIFKNIFKLLLKRLPS